MISELMPFAEAGSAVLRWKAPTPVSLLQGEGSNKIERLLPSGFSLHEDFRGANLDPLQISFFSGSK